MPGIIAGNERLESFSPRTRLGDTQRIEASNPADRYAHSPAPRPPVTGIYRGLRSCPENTYDRTSHAGWFRISGARHWSVTGGIRDPAR
jgi:hypothetical protein